MNHPSLYDSDPLGGCRGAIYAVVVGAIGWSIIGLILWLLFGFFASAAAAQEKAEPAVIAATAEVVAEREQLRDEADVEKVAFDAMTARHGALDERVSKYCREDAPGQLAVYSEPIRFEKQGEYRPIQAFWVRGLESVYECAENSVAAAILKDGTTVYRDPNGAWTAAVSPVGLYADDEIIEDDGAGWTFEQRNARTVRLDGPLPLGAYTEWRVGRGYVKDSVFLPKSVQAHVQKHTPKTLRLVYRLDSSGSSTAWSVLVGDQERTALLLHPDTGAAILRFDEVEVLDEAGAETTAIYSYADGLLSIVIDGAWLADAERVYPVEIDPSINQGEQGDHNNCGDSGASGDRKRFWLKFDLPGLDTCTSVDLKLYASSVNIGGGGSVTARVYTSASASWTSNSTDCATMDGLTYYDTAVSRAFTSSDTAGLYTLSSIQGTTNANSIKYLYDDAGAGVCDPGNITIKIQDNTGGTTRRNDGAYLSNNSDSDSVKFDSSQTYLAITYSGSLGCTTPPTRRSGGGAGMIIGMAMPLDRPLACAGCRIADPGKLTTQYTASVYQVRGSDGHCFSPLRCPSHLIGGLAGPAPTEQRKYTTRVCLQNQGECYENLPSCTGHRGPSGVRCGRVGGPG